MLQQTSKGSKNVVKYDGYVFCYGNYITKNINCVVKNMTLASQRLAKVVKVVNDGVRCWWLDCSFASYFW